MTEPATQALRLKQGGLGIGARRSLSYRAIASVAVATAITAAIVYVAFERSPRWHRFHILAVAFAAAVYLTVHLRGRLRDGMAVVASLLFCLAAIEPYCVDRFLSAIEISTPILEEPRAELGWGPPHPGVFHNTKINASTGQVIWDRYYTIDAQLRRQVISAAEGPAVVFAGGSDIFGMGLPDEETLPQIFADLFGRRLRVVNLGFPGYGPQQTLRGLETGLFDDALKGARLLIISTTPWQAMRSSCVEGYMSRAPRYELVEGRLILAGSCQGSWSWAQRAFSAISSIPRFLVLHAFRTPQPATIDLYLATLVHSAEVAREKYHVPTVVLYLPGYNFLRPTGYTDAQLTQRLRDAGIGVVDATLNAADFPGQDLQIRGEGHPTGVANRALANRLRDYFNTSIAATR